ncbi:MAG: DUF1501 domain-containing protein [Isosphaeraceae bacterium]
MNAQQAQEAARPVLSPPLSRRAWLARAGSGFGGVALAAMLAQHDRAKGGERASAGTDQTQNSKRARAPHFAPKATQVIHVFLEGGPSHVDLFDPKPELSRQDNKPIPVPGENRKAQAFGSPFRFAQRGNSGLEISDLLSLTAGHADELCLIRSMHGDEAAHESAMLQMNCGNGRLARPSVGSWVTYGLGREDQNLPEFVVLYDGGPPVKGVENWQSAFLPATCQATAVDTQHRDVARLLEHIHSPFASAAEQRLQLDLIKNLDRIHAAGHGDDPRLAARIGSFEMAFRMQAAATDAFDITREPASSRELYGDSPIGRQCLLARRLIERGVRFVQVYCSGWDHHDNLTEGLRTLAPNLDRAFAGLLCDLKRLGLLGQTLVVCGGEFGRTPIADGMLTSKKLGRGHNNRGFSTVLAGGGVKAGFAHGKTDEFGFQAVEGKVHIHDLHATMLHLLGLDHERLTYRYAGRDFRLTDVRGRVVKEVLA